MDFSRQFNRLLFFCFIPLVKAYTAFQTTCSTPATPVNFVSSSNARGTLDILWSSLFTIFACTWTLQHPNVPEQRDGHDCGILGVIKYGLQSFYWSILRMLVMMLAPEWIIRVACEEMLVVYEARTKLSTSAHLEDLSKWTLDHIYYANMGGFVIESTPNSESRYPTPFHLTFDDIYKLRYNETRRKNYTLPTLRDIPVKEIKDKSKGDGLVKTIAVVQIIWSTAQIIVRAFRKLSVSPLETAVVAFAFCVIVIYGLYWNKPQRADATITIWRYDGEIPESVLATLELQHRNLIWPWYMNNITSFVNSRVGFFPIYRKFALGSPISLLFARTVSAENKAHQYVAVVCAAIFSAIHAVAWNFSFPSTIELIFWRCAIVVSAAIPLYLLFIQIIDDTFDLPEWWDSFLTFLTIPAGVLYVAAGVFMIIEMFRTLCYLPPDSFVATWTSSIPHVA